MNKSLSYLLFSIFLVALFYLEKIQMFSNEIVDTSGDIRLPVLSIFLICCLSIHTIRDGSASKNIVIKHLLLFFLLIYSISFFVSLFVPFRAGLLTYLLIILPILSCYYIYYITIHIDNLNFVLWGFIVIFIALASFYVMNYRSNILYDITVQSNAVYSAFYFFPFILCIKKKWIKIVGVLITMLIVFYSLKRGGLIALMAGLFIYLIINRIILKKKKLKGIISFFIIIGAVSFILIRYNTLADDMIFGRMSEISETEGSGRGNIWRSKIQLISDSSPSGFILGHGWCSTEIDDPRDSRSAHNDFLEVLYDFGVVALILYLLLYYSLFKYCVELTSKRSNYAAPFGASIGVFLVNSLVSHFVIYPRYFIVIAMFWGYIIAAEKIEDTSNYIGE